MKTLSQRFTIGIEYQWTDKLISVIKIATIELVTAVSADIILQEVVEFVVLHNGFLVEAYLHISFCQCFFQLIVGEDVPASLGIFFFNFQEPEMHVNFDFKTYYSKFKKKMYMYKVKHTHINKNKPFFQIEN